MESKRVSAWADLGVMTAMLLLATLVAGVVFAVTMAVAPTMEREKSTFFFYTLQFTLAVIGGAIWLRASRRNRGLEERFPFRFGVSWSHGPLILAGIVVATAAGVVIEPLLNLMPDHYMKQLEELIGRGGWVIAMTVVAAPLLEELFFRGLLLESLSRRWSARWAVLGSAALFGVMHAPILPQMVNAMVIAVVMGYIYVISRSLVPVIAIHAINNGLAYMALELTGTQTTDIRKTIGNDTLYLMIYAACCAIVIAALCLMDRRARTKITEKSLVTKTTDTNGETQ
jgi:membrane protease YdiL (CAAX protease family)